MDIAFLNASYDRFIVVAYAVCFDIDTERSVDLELKASITTCQQDLASSVYFKRVLLTL